MHHDLAPSGLLRAFLPCAAAISLLLTTGCSSATPLPRKRVQLLASTRPVETTPANYVRQSGETTEQVDPRSRFRRDVAEAPAIVADDLLNIYSSLDSWAVLGSAYLGGRALDEIGFQDSTTKYFRRHSIFGSSASDALDFAGKGQVLIAGSGLWYLWAYNRDNEADVIESKLLLRCLMSTGISTLTFKSVFNDRRPNGGSKAFPSGHAAMSVATATSLWYSYGPRAGLPAAALAALISVQRLDSQYHDLDDIISGMALGWLVASSIRREEPLRLFGASVYPGVSERGQLALLLRWEH